MEQKEGEHRQVKGVGFFADDHEQQTGDGGERGRTIKRLLLVILPGPPIPHPKRHKSQAKQGQRQGIPPDRLSQVGKKGQEQKDEIAAGMIPHFTLDRL